MSTLQQIEEAVKRLPAKDLAKFRAWFLRFGESEEERARIEPALLSEQALAEDWNRPEEDAAWSHLQSEK